MVNRINTEINLEAEFGDLLDALAEHIPVIPEDVVEHFGVKGMKWGVRNDSESGGKTKKASPLVGLGPDKVTRKTPSGEVISLTKDPPIAIARMLAKVSPKSIERYNKGAFITIRDGSGKKVGDAQVEKRSNDELYLLWLGINSSARGKGYATQAMKAAEEFGRSAGFKKMTLEVPGDAPDALHIYTKLGFKELGKTSGTHEGDFWGGLTNMEYVFDDAKHSDLVLVHSSDIVWVHEDDLRHYGIPGMKWGKRSGSSEKTSGKTSEQRKASFKKGAKIAGVTLAVGVTVAAVIIANNKSKKVGTGGSVKSGQDFVNAFSMKNGIWKADISQLNPPAPKSYPPPTGPRLKGPTPPPTGPRRQGPAPRPAPKPTPKPTPKPAPKSKPHRQSPPTIPKPRNQSSRQTGPSLDILSNIMEESSRPPRKFG